MPEFRFRFLLIGLRFEVKCPGARLTGKAPKCSTIIRRELGLKGRPPKLLAQMEQIAKDNGIVLACDQKAAA